MADITSRDFQELIKRQKETTDKLETIVQQNIEDNSARARILDNLPEIVNAQNIASNIIENISGDKLNESSIKATIEDISKKNIDKYL